MRWRALLLAPLTGRRLMVLALHRLPYALREGGTAGIFCGRSQRAAAGLAMLLPPAGAFLLFGLGTGMSLVGLPAVGALLLSRWPRRRIGGATGDTLGATSEVAESLALLAACCPAAGVGTL